MGCASSKKSKCQHCKEPYSPMMGRRSFSVNVHHPPEKRGDSYHVVALTSSTLGSINLEDAKFAAANWDDHLKPDEGRDNEHTLKTNDQQEFGDDDHVGTGQNEEFAMGMIEAKAWSKMIDEKITRVAPRTPIRTPPGEPETIDVNDLMEGLEDYSPLRLKEHLRSFSFHVSADSIPPLVDSPRVDGGGGVCHENGGLLVSPRKTIWFDSQDKETNNGSFMSKALVSEFDPEVISAFRKALEELSPKNPFYLKPRDGVRDQGQQLNGIMAYDVAEEGVDGEVIESVKVNGFVTDEKRVNGGGVGSNGNCYVNGFVDKVLIDDEKENLNPLRNGDVHSNGGVVEEDIEDKSSYEGSFEGSVVEHEDVYEEKKRVVLYFTSLRGVRKTYEDCCYVRLILKGVGVRVDERDVSMHSGFKEELKELLPEGLKGGLPKVFVDETYIGGVEEIRKLHEDGKLENIFQDCEMMDDDGGNLIAVCEACGDIRFVPCETCSGSCKIYYEHDEEDEEEYEEDEYGFQRCPDCNENGLVRCPICCY